MTQHCTQHLIISEEFYREAVGKHSHTRTDHQPIYMWLSDQTPVKSDSTESKGTSTGRGKRNMCMRASVWAGSGSQGPQVGLLSSSGLSAQERALRNPEETLHLSSHNYPNYPLC